MMRLITALALGLFIIKADAQSNLTEAIIIDNSPGYPANGTPWSYTWHNNIGAINVAKVQIYCSASNPANAAKLVSVVQIGHLFITRANPLSLDPQFGPLLEYVTTGPNVNNTSPVQDFGPNYMAVAANENIVLQCSALSMDGNPAEMAEFVVFIWYSK